MSRPRSLGIAVVAITALGLFGSATIAAAQPAPVGPSAPAEAARSTRAMVLLPGVMTGPGTLGTGGMRRLCDPRSVGLTQWRVTWIERVVQPKDAQIKALDDLKAASAKAVELFATACPRRAPRLQTATAQLEMMEKRLDTAIQAVRMVRPAFEAFYASLDATQKAKVDELGPKRSGWLW
ncbi:hypothetical protein GJ689_12300 [Rhodoplanes serenus]|uniref:Spy/CpxP family protein refolding chaperone n=1 Tax=Rhodoplanes serenus TaxID=200615 RepID=A0A9X5AT36_9BRAD|nr:Spy/CpxP family protein refolding chaperone [Rhodoplanes serenus]MTW16984.1 hypothetical protein [Rhodoplanes serenus]